jgi:hypothetical protein
MWLEHPRGLNGGFSIRVTQRSVRVTICQTIHSVDEFLGVIVMIPG